MKTRKIVVESCLNCPYYTELNNVYREGLVGVLSICNAQKGKEIEFTDKMDMPTCYDSVHKTCTLEINHL